MLKADITEALLRCKYMEESIYTLDANSLTKQWLTDGHKRCDEPHSSAKNAIVQETQIESPENPESVESPESPSDGEGKKIEDRQQKSFPYQRDCLDVLERVCNDDTCIIFRFWRCIGKTTRSRLLWHNEQENWAGSNKHWWKSSINEMA